MDTMGNIFVSIIMLTYNRIKFVSKMIEDILNQTYANYEFIIVDNGSNDGTFSLLEGYARKDSRIKILQIKESSMIGFARNRGVEVSKGKYVAFVDDDDRVDRDFLKFLIELMEENQADISMCGASEGDGIERRPQCLFNEKMLLTGEEATSLLMGRKYIRAGMPTKLYKREILEKFPFVENYKNEDIHTQYKYLLSAKRVAIYGLDHYYFMRHENNVSGFTSNPSGWDKKTMRDYLDAYQTRTEYIKKNAPNIYELALYSQWSFMISMIDKIESYNITECKEIEKELLRELISKKKVFLNMPYIQDFERQWIERYCRAEKWE